MKSLIQKLRRRQRRGFFGVRDIHVAESGEMLSELVNVGTVVENQRISCLRPPVGQREL